MLMQASYTDLTLPLQCSHSSDPCPMANPLNQSDRSVPPPYRLDPNQGFNDAVLTLTEYGDYECPDCARCHFIIKAMQQQLGARFRFVFHHFPQRDRHPHAQNAAEAAQAAAAQGKFWHMHKYLAEHQQALTDADLVEYAIWSNLDLPQFLNAMSQHTYAQRVQADLDAGMHRGVTQTPTFFVSSPYWDGEWELEALLTVQPYTNNQFEDEWLEHLQLLVSDVNNLWRTDPLPIAS
jgi:protein-disulfide isomerase